VADSLGKIGNALLQMIQAAAPLGGPILQALGSIADAFARIADSPLGTPIFTAVAALSALSLAANAGTAAVTRLNGALLATGAASARASSGMAALAGGPAGITALVGITNLTGGLENLQQTLSG